MAIAGTVVGGGRSKKNKYVINYVLPMGLGRNICEMLAGKAESRE